MHVIYEGRAPFPAQPGSGTLRVKDELGKGDPVMSVYVGIDVHRKRSQVAVVAEDGKVLKRETDRQALLVKKAHLCERQLRFVASALGDLFRDENFVNLLRAESLDSLPKYLATSIEKR